MINNMHLIALINAISQFIDKINMISLKECIFIANSAKFEVLKNIYFNIRYMNSCQVFPILYKNNISISTHNIYTIRVPFHAFYQDQCHNLSPYTKI